MRGVVAATGHPALPLDDAFIHLQYAKRLAEGAPLVYAAGRGATTGATSLAWPTVLAPFYALGARGTSLVAVTWALGIAAHAALAIETARVATRLTDRVLGVAAGAMCLAFGAFAWFAASGMETLPFAWILMCCARLGGEVADDPEADGGPRRALMAAGFFAPLVRPEGVLGAGIAAAALLRASRGRRRVDALVPLAGVAVPPLINLAVAGHLASSTTIVKWIALNPYVGPRSLAVAVFENAKLLASNVLDGGDWTSVFLPEGSMIAFGLGGAALLGLVVWRRRAPFTAAAVMAIALGALIPCSYESFLWNRLRYVWPFAPSMFVLVACLGRVVAGLGRRLHPQLTALGVLVAGGYAGALATHLPLAMRDLAESASAVDRQQATLGRWAKQHLPKDALVGVNDTGAIAYLGDRATFDIVGLTTEGEARYWVAGAGSRYEHYERLGRARLPTHFIVYPKWMANPTVLGAELTSATVEDQAILGEPTMTAYVARWDFLGSGDLPFRPPAGAPIDELDVADLDSEAAHDFVLPPATDADNHVAADVDCPRDEHGDVRCVDGRAPRLVVDGGRAHRKRDAFRMRFGPSKRGLFVARLGQATWEAPTGPSPRVRVFVDDRCAGEIELSGSTFDEAALPVEASLRAARIRVEGAHGERFSSFHYWLYPTP